MRGKACRNDLQTECPLIAQISRAFGHGSRRIGRRHRRADNPLGGASAFREGAVSVASAPETLLISVEAVRGGCQPKPLIFFGWDALASPATSSGRLRT
jgi:hypothetical protein